MSPSSIPKPGRSAEAYLSAANRPDRSYFEMPLALLRRRYFDEFAWGSGKPEPVESVAMVDVEGVACRLYHSGKNDRAVLVWLHGGGWNLGDLDCHDWIARALANRAECAVLSVGYRLAPEHPYPAAVEDAWDAVVWASRHFDLVAVGGDSAGGNLAAAVGLRARDVGLRLELQVLVYPVLDYRVDHPSYDDFARRYAGFAGRPDFGESFQSTIRDIWKQYVPDPARRGETDASPLRADSLRGVAPVILISAEHDILRPEGREFARRLRDDDVDVQEVDYPGQIHGFFPLLRVMPEARDAVARCAAALATAFASSSASAR